MRIVSLAVTTPTRRYDNDELLGQIGEWALETHMSQGERTLLLERVGELLSRAGSRYRFLEPSPPRGYAMELLRDAAGQALVQASRDPQDIDLLIYCSVARGWMEPSSASAAQAAVGVVNASCFDVLEACAGWMRAIEIADAMMRGGRYRNALIVGAEAGMRDLIAPRGRSVRVLDEHLAGFTIGEAATAMIVEPDPSQPIEIDIRSDGKLHDACMIPLGQIESFLLPGVDSSPEPDRFLSHSGRLFAGAIAALVGMMRPRIAAMEPDEVDLYIIHGASATASEAVRGMLGVPASKWLCGHAEFGNTVSMSMPVALDHALSTGRAKHGDRICFLVASAGISFGYGMLTC